MRDKKVTFIVQAAVIAALYVVLTFVANALGLASHTIQVRFSEALCILPVFTPAAIPGLWIMSAPICPPPWPLLPRTIIW